MKRIVKNYIVEIISALTLSVLALLYYIFEQTILNVALSLRFAPQIILRLIIALLWLGLVILSFYLHEINKNRLKVHFNLYWDKKLNPFCPACKSPLTFYAEYKGYKNPLFYCTKCGKEIEATGENGNAFTLDEVRKKIKNK